MSLTVDLSTLSGWAEVESGTHTLTIKAKASGYRDSNASTGVTFNKTTLLTSSALSLPKSLPCTLLSQADLPCSLGSLGFCTCCSLYLEHLPFICLPD